MAAQYQPTHEPAAVAVPSKIYSVKAKYTSEDDQLGRNV
jgi:hypothetical protein